MSSLFKRAGMRLEQFRETEGCIEAKLVGIQGHWEDGAALMWDTEMKKLGLEPYQEDEEWNKLLDSKGNRLYGTKKSRINGIWLKWKKPTQSVTEESMSEMKEDRRYDAKEDLRLYRTIHARRTERENRMAARNELMKMSLTERQIVYHFDGHHLCTPFGIVMATFVMIAAGSILYGTALIFHGKAGQEHDAAPPTPRSLNRDTSRKDGYSAMWASTDQTLEHASPVGSGESFVGYLASGADSRSKGSSKGEGAESGQGGVGSGGGGEGQRLLEVMRSRRPAVPPLSDQERLARESVRGGRRKA